MSTTAWKYYHDHAQNLIDWHNPPYPVVLKTDLWNEINQTPTPHGILGDRDDADVHYIETRQDYVDQYNHPQAIQGDIRQLPYPPLTFDIILDLSTIDHIPPTDLGTVLLEYHRTAKYGATITIITWTNNKRNMEIPGQTYHHRANLEYLLNKYYEIIEIDDDIIPPDNNQGILVRYTLRKVTYKP